MGGGADIVQQGNKHMYMEYQSLTSGVHSVMGLGTRRGGWDSRRGGGVSVQQGKHYLYVDHQGPTVGVGLVGAARPGGLGGGSLSFCAAGHGDHAEHRRPGGRLIAPNVEQGCHGSRARTT
jgi:hypothetical protein